MTGPIIPAELWPEGAVALLWNDEGHGQKLVRTRDEWMLLSADTPMPAGHDWRVPVMRQAAKAAEADRLLALIDGQGVSERPQKGRCPNNSAPGGCQLPNRFCTFPSCEKADKLLPTKGEGEANVRSSSEHI